MRIFLAGASGVIGRRLTPLLIEAGHAVVGTTRSPENAAAIAAAGALPVVVDVLDAAALMQAVLTAQPEVVIHQLTDLPSVLDIGDMAAVLARNARIRIEGTRNLVDAALAAGAGRVVAQSIAFVYAPGPEPHRESDPLASDAGEGGVSIRGVRGLEDAVTGTAGLVGLALRYGSLYGPGTWNETPPDRMPLHVDAAAHAARLAVTRGAPGIYNVAEDDGAVSSEKAKRELGFDASFRMRER
jgi:nucleoside-diphosphate-sugar epimerase